VVARTGRDAASPLCPVLATTSVSGHTEDKSQGPLTGRKPDVTL
jgi:hypothetical protein